MEKKHEKAIVTEKSRVACDGGGGVLGHPKIYLEMGEKGEVECPYCGQVFILKKNTPTK